MREHLLLTGYRLLSIAGAVGLPALCLTYAAKSMQQPSLLGLLMLQGLLSSLAISLAILGEAGYWSSQEAKKDEKP